MRPILLIDFGSTCTKLTAVDLDSRQVLGGAQDFTTVQTDISLGLEKAERKLERMSSRKRKRNAWRRSRRKRINGRRP